MKEVTAYQCEFCKKLFTLAKNAKRHETGCYKNPVSRSCYSCEYLDWRYIRIDEITVREIPFCTKLNTQLDRKETESAQKFKRGCDDWKMNSFKSNPEDQ